MPAATCSREYVLDRLTVGRFGPVWKTDALCWGERSSTLHIVESTWAFVLEISVPQTREKHSFKWAFRLFIASASPILKEELVRSQELGRRFVSSWLLDATAMHEKFCSTHSFKTDSKDNDPQENLYAPLYERLANVRFEYVNDCMHLPDICFPMS